MRKWLCKSVYTALVIGFIIVQLVSLGTDGGGSGWALLLLGGAQLWQSVCTLTGWNPDMDQKSQWYRSFYGWSTIAFLAFVGLLVLVPVDWRAKLWLLAGTLIVMTVLLIWAERKEKGRK